MGNYLGLDVHNVNWDAHITLLYYGSKGPSVNEAESHLKGYTDLNWYVQNMGTDLFGPKNDILVSIVPSSVINPIRRALQTIMHELGHFEDDTYGPGWTPHVTLPVGLDPIHVPYLFKIGSLFLYRDGKHNFI